MTKSLKPAAKESKKPRGRNGGRIPLSPKDKRELAYFYLPHALLEAFKLLIPVAADRSNLILSWVRAYTVAGGEGDRLLVQSPLATELLTYLEVTGAPEDLRDRLESLIVQRVSDEAKLEQGVKVKDS
jgi:hypothetical protein